MSNTERPQRFVELLAARDFTGLESLFAPTATARFLLPRGPEEQQGGRHIVGRFRDWFAAATSLEMTSSAVEAIGQRQRLTWELRVERGGGFPETIRQDVYLDLAPEGIQRIDLLCSGFHAVEAVPESCAVAVFDAGDLGCADGLAEEFRRRITAVPMGSSLQVVAADPAAKEDLPPLARMLGPTVRSTGTLPDGRLAITVERGK